MSTGLYLQLNDDTLLWEEVDSYTWDNWQNALNQKGEARYSGNRVKIGPTKAIQIQASNLTSRDLAVIMRFCGIRENEAPSSVPGGFVRRPEFIRFTQKRTKKTTLHEMGGENYTCRKK